MEQWPSRCTSGLGGSLGSRLCCDSDLAWGQRDCTTEAIQKRSMAAAFVYTLGVTESMMTLTYYLPVWFQAIKSASPTRSGVMMLPMVVPSGVTGLLSGIAISKLFGYYVPFMLACSAFMAIGAGLLTTFNPWTGQAAWVGYQFIWGFGAGLGQYSASYGQSVANVARCPIWWSRCTNSPHQNESAAGHFTKLLCSIASRFRLSGNRPDDLHERSAQETGWHSRRRRRFVGRYRCLRARSGQCSATAEGAFGIQ